MSEYLSLWRGVISTRPRMAELCDVVARQHGVNTIDLRGPSQHRFIAWPRQAFMAHARAAGYTTTQIGRFLGGRDHTTVIHGSRRHAEREGARA